MKMKSTALLLAGTIVTILAGTQAAEAGRRWHWQFPEVFEPIPPFDEYDEDDAYASPYADEEEFDTYYVPPRKRLRVEEDVAPWWLETPAWKKLRHRQPRLEAQDLEPTYTPDKRRATPKSKVAAKPTPRQAVVPVERPKQLASAATPATKPAQPKPIIKLTTAAPVKPTAISPKPSVKTARKNSAKTIGCTAGAAVVTGYGFANVTPRTCTGNIYAYNAVRDGKPYIIKLTATQGEITEVSKQ